MSVIHRCAPPERVRPAQLPLRGPGDALGVIMAGVDVEFPAVGCLLLDDAHRGLTCLAVTGRTDASTVFDVGELMATAAADHGDVAALVLASIRPGQDHQPEEGEPEAFSELRDLLADAGIELLDWFIISRGYATSLAELTEAVPLWRG